MDFQLIFLKGVLICALFTSLITESLKKVIASENRADNVLAAVVAICVGLFIGIDYVLVNNMVFDVTSISAIIVLVICSFICATCGYDKFMQTIEQIRGVRNGRNL